MSQTVKLPDEVYEALREASRGSGMTPEDWIAAQLPVLDKCDGRWSIPKEMARANARLRKHIISSGQPGSYDNEQIDADLARRAGEEVRTLFS